MCVFWAFQRLLGFATRVYNQPMPSRLKALNVIGLNSGTSMDGIDAALFRIAPDNGCTANKPRLTTEMLASDLYEFEPDFQKKLKNLVAKGQASLNETCRLNVAIAEVFAAAVHQLLKKAHLTSADVDLIGSHGQTIWHAPEYKSFWGVPTRATMQLGDSSVIAARTGLPVISDFRVKDMAYGGQGAPLVAFADEVLFGHESVASGILNIGGIANITVIDNSGQAVMAFDTGPGNMIMDHAAKILFGAECDFNGNFAAKGKINQAWLNELMKHPYFQTKPPKTTGREDFGKQFADSLLSYIEKENISREDTLATLTALTAKSIAQSYKDFIAPQVSIKRLVLGGGGAENATLKRMLTEFWPGEVSIHRHEDFGISTKFKEALLFAILAYTTHFGIANNVPSCTGATRKVSLGTICLP